MQAAPSDSGNSKSDRKRIRDRRGASEHELSDGRRSALLFFYIAALISASAISLAAKIPSFRTLLFALAVDSAGVAKLWDGTARSVAGHRSVS